MANNEMNDLIKANIKDFDKHESSIYIKAFRDGYLYGTKQISEKLRAAADDIDIMYEVERRG